VSCDPVLAVSCDRTAIYSLYGVAIQYYWALARTEHLNTIMSIRNHMHW
jgi:hypothetical protein